MGRRKTTDEFINGSKEVHGYSKYEYNLVVYINNATKVKIGCFIHGLFLQTPDKHLRGQGCPKCGGTVRLSKNEFIKKSKGIHGDKYDYSFIKYVNQKTKVEIVCSVHGIFSQTPSDHLNGCGCPKCAGKNKTTEEFIKESNIIHNNMYEYPDEYINSTTKIKIICPKHGEFLQRPNDHLSCYGCPKCNSSKGELNIEKYLIDMDIFFNTQKTFNDCKHKRQLPFDFYLPEFNTCIEYDGRQHFEPVDAFGGDKSFIELQKRDKIKNEYCYNNNIHLLRISYKDNIVEKLEMLLSCKNKE